MITTFAKLRTSAGLEHRGQLPRDANRSECDLHYPFDGRVADGPLFVAAAMEDKWDIYLNDGYLYFARSWTGSLEAVARIEFGETARIQWVAATSGGDLGQGARHDVRVVDFLMKSHIYRRVAPHPLPAGFPEDPTQIARYSMSLYGRWALFASYEDTTLYDPWAVATS